MNPELEKRIREGMTGAASDDFFDYISKSYPNADKMVGTQLQELRNAFLAGGISICVRLQKAAKEESEVTGAQKMADTEASYLASFLAQLSGKSVAKITKKLAAELSKKAVAKIQEN